MTNVPKTFIRCLRRMPGFEVFWFGSRTSSAETCSTLGNAVQFTCQVERRRDLVSRVGGSGQPAQRRLSRPVGTPPQQRTRHGGTLAGALAIRLVQLRKR